MLEADNLECVRGERRLFAGLGFRLEAGELLYLQGKNGSGKTSLLRMLIGLLPPETGEIRWKGESIKSDDFRADLCYLGHLNAIKEACQRYITSTLKVRLTASIASAFEKAGLPFNPSAVALDPDDPDQQTLLIAYPAVSAQPGDYNPPTVKIEAGAKSALDPHRATMVTPYLAEDVPNLMLNVTNVVTIDAERTFWDKVVILHGQRRWFERRGELRRQGQRVSRHYYDIYRLLRSDVGQRAAHDLDLARGCARHARMFFNSSDLDLATAHPGTFSLSPLPEMDIQLRRDYTAMAGMIFGEVPEWETIVETIRQFEEQVNAGASQ